MTILTATNAIRVPVRPPDRFDVARVSVRLLGSFEVRGPGGGVVLGARDLGGGKPRQIMAILVLNAGTVVSKERLVGLLWPERAPAEALATVESYVSLLRHQLLAVCSSRTDLVRTAVAGYTIDRERIDLDLDRFSVLLRLAEDAEPVRSHAALQEALAMAEAPLLVEEAACSWADDVRRVHGHRVVEASIRAARAAEALGRTDQALELAVRALLAEPHNEAAWAARLTALERAGRHADALRVYAECRRRFAAELGCAPGPVLQDVLGRLLTGAAEPDGELGDLLVALLRVRDHVVGTGDGVGDPGSLHQACTTLLDLVTRARAAD